VKKEEEEEKEREEQRLNMQSLPGPSLSINDPFQLERVVNLLLQ